MPRRRRALSALRRHLRADFSRDEGVSEVLGNIIMVALSVSMLGAFGTLVLTTVSSDTPVAPAASFTMRPEIGATSIDVRLLSGSSLDLDETTLTLAVDGTHELGNAAVLSPAHVGTWSVGETLRIDLISATLAAGQKIGFFAADRAAGKAIGAAYADVPSATSGTAILQNVLTLDLDFDESPLVADGTSYVNATLAVTSTHGLLLIDHVSLNLSPVDGVADLRLYDDGHYPDADAGDGIFTAPFRVSDHTFSSLPGYDNITLRAEVVDVLGTTTATTGVLFITTPTPSKVGAGVVYSNIGSSGEIREEGYINLSSFAFRDVTAIDADQVEMRVSDLADSTKVWSALVSFANTGCSGPAVISIVLRIDGVAGNVTYTPASGCFLLDADARLNLANVPSSTDASGLPATWNAVATTNPVTAFQYAEAGISTQNEALIAFFGDTLSSSPFARGLSQTDFSWAPPANTGPVTAPDAITTLAATAGNALVDLTWSAPASGGSAITSYNVYQDGVLIASIPPGTSYQATGLTNGVSYSFIVRAVNGVGEAAASNAAIATPRTVPGAPTVPSANEGNQTITLTWVAPASDGGSPITNYHVYGSTTSGATTYLASTGGANTTFVVNGLTNGDTWFFNVTAANAFGQGASSVQTSGTPSTIPYPPNALAATAGDARVTLTWSAGNNGGLALTNYFIYRGTTSGSTTLLAATGIGTNTSFIDMTAANGVTYYYNITTRNANGVSATSNEASATPTSANTAPSQPLALAGESLNHTVRLTWSAPASDGGSAITSYKIYASTTSGATIYIGTTGGTNRTFDINGLTNGVLLFFNVTAVNAIGESPSSAQQSATPIGVPYPPTALAGTRGNQTVTLTWSAPADTGGAPITNYYVYMGTSSGATTFLAATGSGTPGYVATGLTNGVTYFFNVTAVNTAGQGSSSSEASAVPATVPNPPSNLAAAAGDTSVTLTWGTPTNGGSAITTYHIYRGTASGATTFLASTGSGANTSFVVNGLTNGVPSFFNVTAVNSVGTSSTSNEATATPAGLPSAPVSLTATKGNTTVQLSWSAPVSNGGSSITDYHVYRGTSSGAATYIGSTGGATSFLSTGLTNGQIYYYNVTAQNAVGQGPTSNEASATPSTVPWPPTSLSATAGAGQASLSWSVPISNGGSAITGYNVYRGTTSGATTFLAFTGSTSTNYVATGLTNGVTYFFNVTAVNANGQSATSNEASATPATLPSAPQTLTATKGNTTVALSWSAPASTGGSPLTDYAIYVGTSSGATTYLGSMGGTNTTFIVNGLTNGQAYFFNVTAFNGVGQGASSNEATATPSTVPWPPTNLAATRGNSSASLTWTTPITNGGSAITGYNIYRGTSSGATTFLVFTGSTSTNYAASGLTNGVTYFFNVTAVNANGQSASSNEASVTPATNPEPPSGLVATSGLAQVSLSWTAGSTGGSAITNYQIWRGGVLLATIGTNTSFIDLAVIGGTSYTYEIRAVNGIGTSSPSNAASATPFAHTYASTTTTSITGGTITNAANFARDNGGDVATLAEAGTTTITSFPTSANDRHFNTSPNTWALVGSSNVALTFPTTGGNPGGAMLVRSTSGTWSATIENSFTLSTAASTAAAFGVDAYTTGGGTITFTLVKPGGATVALGSTSAGVYTTTTATVAASDLSTTGTYILRVSIAGSGNNKDTYVDNLYLNVPSASNNQFGHEFTLSGIPTGTTYTLEVRARQVTGAEGLAIRTPGGTTLATISSTTMTTYSVTVTPTAGVYTLRLIDVTTSGDPAASTWELDYIRVVTT